MVPQADLDLLSPFCVDIEGSPVSITSETVYPDYNSSFDWALANKCPNSTLDGDVHRVFMSTTLRLPDNRTSVSALLCQQMYSMTRRVIKTTWAGSAPGSIVEVSNDDVESIPLEYDLQQITSGIMSTPQWPIQRIIHNDSRCLDFWAAGYNSSIDMNSCNIWATLMNFTLPCPDMAAFANPTYLSSAFQKAFKAMAAQVAKSLGTIANNRTVVGTVSYEETRLVVQKLPLRLMEGLLSILTLISLGLTILRPTDHPRHLNLILSLAYILSRNQALARFLSDIDESKQDGDIPSTTKAQEQPATLSERESTKIAGKSATASSNLGDIQWWRPLSSTTAFAASIVCLSLVVVAALEILLQYSETHAGIAEVAIEGYLRYTWLLTPIAFMSLMALAYGMVDSSVRILHPFQELRRNRPSNVNAIMFDPFRQVTLLGLPQAISHGYFTLSAAMAISLLRPFLAIGASGLYTPTHLTLSQDMEIEIRDWFDIHNAWMDDRMDGGIYDETGQDMQSIYNQATIFNNMSFPRGTYDGFAFAGILPDPGAKYGIHQTAALEIQMPAARGNFNCTVLDVASSDLSLGFVDAARTMQFTSVPRPPPGCVPGPSASNDTKFIFFTLADTSDGWIGSVIDTGWFDPESAKSLAGERDHRTPYTACSDNLQHIFLYYGYQKGNYTDQLTMLHCMPYVEVLYVNATLRMPSLEVEDRNATPPTVVAGSGEVWNVMNATESTIPFPRMLDLTVWDLNLDDFFTALVAGSGGTPVEQLMNPANRNSTIRKMDHLYAQMTAVALQLRYRVPVLNITHANGTPAASSSKFISKPINGSAVVEIYRLAQSPISTRILEGLLLALTACTIASLLLAKDKKTLSQDPGSIAAGLRLLDGSKLVEQMRHSTMASEKAGSWVRLFRGKTFALGWWERAGSNEARNWVYGIDVLESNSAFRLDRD